MNRICFVMAAALLPLLAQAEVYKWTDANGQVHYSQTPPPSGSYESVRPAPPAGESPNAEELSKTLSDQQAKDSKAKAKETKDAGLQQRRADACAHNRKRLTDFRNTRANRLGVTGEDGTVSRMTQEQYDAEIARTEEAIAATCDE